MITVQTAITMIIAVILLGTLITTVTNSMWLHEKNLAINGSPDIQNLTSNVTGVSRILLLLVPVFLVLTFVISLIRAKVLNG